MTPSRSSPQAVSRYASSDCRTPKRSGATGPGRPFGRGLDAALGREAGRRRRRRPRARRAPRERPRPTSRRSSEGSSGIARPSWRRIQRASRCGRRVLRLEDVALDTVALAAVRALDPPGGVGRDLDRRVPADDVAELPVGAAAVVLDVELRRQPEVALAARREPDVRADARDAERPDVGALEVVADHVPRAVLGQQRVRVERALLFLVAVDRPVAELDGALLRDRALELAEPALELGRVVGVAHLDPHRGAGRRAPRARRRSGRARGSAARAAAARRRRTVPRGGRSTSEARRAPRRRARARAGSTARSAACRAPRR